MLTVLAFVFVLGVLIFFHELGHFLVAKKVGIRVDRFSLGFPPNIFKRKFGETTYCIGIIPLGGYVKMAGEHPNEEASGAPEEFMSKSVAQRAAVIFAGPFMNYVLAILLLAGIYFFAGIPYSDPDRIFIGEVAEDSPADGAGLLADDQIIAVNSRPVIVFDSLRTIINQVIEAPVEVVWVRGNDTLSANIVTRSNELPNAEGGVDTVGEIGISEKILGYQKYGPVEAVSNGFVTTHVILWETVKFVKKLVVGEVSSRMLGGPLFIAQQSGREARRGISRLLFFMALLSVNLAVLNVLPIPVLDGGYLVFLAIEKVRGAPLSMKARLVAQNIGMVALLTLIVFVTYNDILRFLRGL